MISATQAGAYEDFFDAVKRDDGDTVRALVLRGMDPNSRSPQGQTALHLALRDRSLRVADALWASPALDVNALNASGETPLMLAALRGDIGWVNRLIERGAKVHQEGWSPLHYAATGNEPRIVALLLDRGAPIDAPSPNRSTPLMMAARYGAEASVDLLLARGADKRLRNDLGLDAGAFAKLGGREFLLQRLDVSPR
ncbi:MAG TPA: ankyrin repeat domain-containing protein [Acidiferrobacterales bacterium]|nr:ankyrin repeat domain-containing protein [Acidiferrobacterales bacterium]